MGAGVSNWCLARAVSRLGQLGVVSGTALDNILARRLQDGDPGGHMQRAMKSFPSPEIAKRILDKYYIPGGRKPHEPYKSVPMFTLEPSTEIQELNVVSNFVEVHLAKEGHRGLVGINYLEKIQMHSLACLYGAMLAGVDYVLMGAGIPRAIPGVIDTLTSHSEVSMKAHMDGAGPEDDFRVKFDPKKVIREALDALKRPKFLAIVASNVLALTLAKKASGKVDGFIVEGPTAGGHNAPPRGEKVFNDLGEPVYGPKDEVNLEDLKKLGLPFWLAGSFGEPEKVKQSLEQGAAGVQVGTAFAYCEESGMAEFIKDRVIEKALAGEASIFTDATASPTGFPFKVVNIEGTLSDPKEYEIRQRSCTLGYLRVPYKRPDGTAGYRCPSEPVEQYLRHGGNIEETKGRKCLCNGLMANIGLPQHCANGYVELPLVTSGDDVKNIWRFLAKGEKTYTAGDVIRNLLSALKPAEIATAAAI